MKKIVLIIIILLSILVFSCDESDDNDNNLSPTPNPTYIEPTPNPSNIPTTFLKFYHHYLRTSFFDITECQDNGFLVCGEKSDYGQNAIIHKIDSSGNIEWEYLKDINMDISHSFKKTFQDSQGNYLGYGTVYPRYGGYYGIISKFNHNGGLIWENTFSFPVKGLVESDNGYIICGNWSGINLVKIDYEGYTVWEENYFPENYNIGGTDLILSKDNCFVISGYKVENNQSKLMLMKISKDREVLFQSTFNANLPNYRPESKVLELNNEYIIYTNINQEYLDGIYIYSPFLVKFDSDGNNLAYKTLDYIGQISKMIKTNDNNIVFTGFKKINENENRLIISKINQNLDEIWFKDYIIGDLDSSKGNGITLTKDNGLAIVGEIYVLHFDHNAFLLKSDLDGNY